MKLKKYLVESKKTQSNEFNITAREKYMLHGAIGLVTESGELLDAFKKSIYYGKEMDMVNLKEELGDIMWYMAIILRETGWTLEDIMELNIQKLRLRYGEKFETEKSIKRNLKAERKILES